MLLWPCTLFSLGSFSPCFRRVNGLWRVRQRWLTPAAPVAGGCSLLSGNDALFPISCPKCCSLCRPPSVPAHAQTLIPGLALCSKREFWGRERAGNSGFGWQDLCLALESSGKCQQAGFGGAAPGLGSLLVPFVVMVLPWGSRGTLLWRWETDPAAFAAENFPASSQGTLLEQNQGIQPGVIRRRIQILPNTWIGSLLSSVDSQLGCRGAMAL